MPGQHNPADVLSRMPLTNQPCRERDIAEEYVHCLTVRAVPKAFSLEQISAATSSPASEKGFKFWAVAKRQGNQPLPKA